MLILAFGGTARIGLHACMLEIDLIMLTLFIFAKPISVSFLYHVKEPHPVA